MAQEFLTAQEIYDRVDDQRRDTGDSSVDTAKKHRALTAILDIISSRASWRFAVRNKVIAYYAGLPNYHFQNQLGLSDFKELKDLRPQKWNGRAFEYIEDDEFAGQYARMDARPYVAIEHVDGFPTLRINYANYVMPEAILSTLTDVGDNGIWSVEDDAVNVRQDVGYYKYGASSLAFDIDVSASVANKATIVNSSLASLDISEYENLAHGFVWIYLPATLVTYLNSIDVKWGSTSANYWSKNLTAPGDGNAYREGWNLLEFGWESATETGTGDPSALAYAALSLNYGASCPDITGVRVSKMWFSRPEFMDMAYYSDFLVIDGTTGVRKRKVEDGTDKLLIPTAHKETLVEGMLWQVMDQMGTNSGKDSERHLLLFEYGYAKDPGKSARMRKGGMTLLIKDFAVKSGGARRKFRINPAVED